jgi:hypothetical protein
MSQVALRHPYIVRRVESEHRGRAQGREPAAPTLASPEASSGPSRACRRSERRCGAASTAATRHETTEPEHPRRRDTQSACLPVRPMVRADPLVVGKLGLPRRRYRPQRDRHIERLQILEQHPPPVTRPGEGADRACALLARPPLPATRTPLTDDRRGRRHAVNRHRSRPLGRVRPHPPRTLRVHRTDLRRPTASAGVHRNVGSVQDFRGLALPSTDSGSYYCGPS